MVRISGYWFERKFRRLARAPHFNCPHTGHDFDRTAKRRMKGAASIALAAAFSLGGCAQTAATSVTDPTVHVALIDSGPTALRCRIMFGHWVNRDLGVLEPGSETGFDVQQSPKDGALYILRSDGQRRMMIENLYCAAAGGPHSTEGQVDLAPARASRPSAIMARCAFRPGRSQVECPPAILKP